MKPDKEQSRCVICNHPIKHGAQYCEDHWRRYTPKTQPLTTEQKPISVLSLRYGGRGSADGVIYTIELSRTIDDGELEKIKDAIEGVKSEIIVKPPSTNKERIAWIEK